MLHHADLNSINLVIIIINLARDLNGWSRSYALPFILVVRQHYLHGGGGFSAKFRVRVCRRQFQNGTVGKANFCEYDTLGKTNFYIKSALSWRFLDKTCQVSTFSGPNF